MFIVGLKQTFVKKGYTAMKQITIIGAGMMGSAMAFPATDNGYLVNLVGTPLDREIIDNLKKDRHHLTLKRDIPQNVSFYQFEQVSQALAGSQLVIGGVSSFGIDWFAQFVLPILDKNMPVLMITKGLKSDESGNLIPFPIWLSSLPAGEGKSINAVGGPCISFELADRMQTQVAFCGRDVDTLNKIKNMLSTEYYHISPTTDIAGIETAVAMKNAYAMAVSLAIGIAKKDDDNAIEKYNPQAGLFYQAVKEMNSIIELCGGQLPALFFGAGDLYVTVFGGRTRLLGTLLGKGNTFAQASEILSGVTLESVAVTKKVCEALTLKGVLENYPLLHHIDCLLNNAADTKIPWDKFCM